MKKSLIFAVISFVLLLIIPSAHALLIKTDSAVINSLDAGSSFTLNVGIQDAADLAGFQFELVYNSDIVSVSSVVLSNFLETPGRIIVKIAGISEYEIDNDAGRLSCNRMTQGSGAGADGSGTLAAITFQIKKWEDDFLNLENVHLTDTKGAELPVSATDSEIRPRYHISASATAGGSIVPSGDMLVKSGGSQEFIVTPAPNYHITNVTAVGYSEIAKGIYRFEHVVSNHTIHIEFCSDVPGDINGDAAVDLSDAILALRILSGIDTGDTKIFSGADISGDGRIGIEELVYILQKVSELR